MIWYLLLTLQVESVLRVGLECVLALPAFRHWGGVDRVLELFERSVGKPWIATVLRILSSIDRQSAYTLLGQHRGVRTLRRCRCCLLRHSVAAKRLGFL